MKKRIISLSLVFVLVFMCGAPSLASSTHAIGEFVSSEQVGIILSENPDKKISVAKPLYDADETIIAYCIELSGGGFVVQDIYGDIVEYSLTADSPFLQAAPDKKLYITAPMSYFEKGAAGEFISVYSGNTATKEDIGRNNAVRKNIERKALLSEESVNAVASANYSPPPDYVITSGQTTYVPRNYSYNPGNNICLATASATLIAYYDDYINQNIAPSSFVDATGTTLTLWLAERTYVEPAPVLWQGFHLGVIKSFIATYATGPAVLIAADYISGLYNAYSQLKSKISANKPVVIVFDGWFYDQSTSAGRSFHAVCAYGYREVITSSGIRYDYVLCVDGRGSTQRYINSVYVTDCFYLT